MMTTLSGQIPQHGVLNKTLVDTGSDGHILIKTVFLASYPRFSVSGVPRLSFAGPSRRYRSLIMWADPADSDAQKRKKNEKKLETDLLLGKVLYSASPTPLAGVTRYRVPCAENPPRSHPPHESIVFASTSTRS